MPRCQDIVTTTHEIPNHNQSMVSILCLVVVCSLNIEKYFQTNRNTFKF